VFELLWFAGHGRCRFLLGICIHGGNSLAANVRPVEDGSQLPKIGAVKSVHCSGMAVTVDMQNTGDPVVRTEIVALIEHVLGDRPGDWRVSIIGSQANDRWEMRIAGPNGFERSYTLEGSSGEHRPEAIAVLLCRLVPQDRRVS